MNDRSDYVRADAVQNPKATKEHIDKALDDKELIVQDAAMQTSNYKNIIQTVTKPL